MIARRRGVGAMFGATGGAAVAAQSPGIFSGGPIPGQTIQITPADQMVWDPGYPGGMIGPGDSPLGTNPQPGDIAYTSLGVPTVPTDAAGNPLTFMGQYGAWIVLAALGVFGLAMVTGGGRRR